jgi:uncharacterized protein YukJ
MECSLDNKITHMILIPKDMPGGRAFFDELLQHGMVKHKTRRGATVLYYMNKRGNQVKKRYVYDTAE